MIHCDIETCVGCRMCEVACGSFHFDAVSPALSRIRVAKLEEIGLDMAVVCQSCVEKPCLECPTEGLTVGRKGEILLNPDLCNACGECVAACPIGAVGFYDERPLFCDLCDGATACVQVCPTQSLTIGEPDFEISLEDFLSVEGSPAEKRAHFVRVQGEPVRASWKQGARMDP